MLSAPRRLLAASSSTASHLFTSPLPSPYLIIGPSRDLFRPFTTSVSSQNHPSTRPSPTKLALRTQKLRAKQKTREGRTVNKAARKQRELEKKTFREHELLAKRSTAKDLAEGLDPLTEKELESMYLGLLQSKPEDLALPALTSGEEKSPQAVLADPSRRELDREGREDRVEALRKRLGELENEATEVEETEEGAAGLAERLQGRRKAEEVDQEGPEKTTRAVGEVKSVPAQVLDRLEGLNEQLNAGAMIATEEGSVLVPRGIAVRSEWKDLILACAESDDVDTVIRGLSLMQSSSQVTDAEILTDVLALYSSQGRPRDALALATYARENKFPLSVISHHHLLVSLLPSHPDVAITHLHSLEAAGHTPLLSTYTACIRSFLSPSSPAHLVQRGWDLYAHTRFIAHPIPSVELFSEMIQACSRGLKPSPERALDLFTEMTEDNNLPPTEYAYNGVIRACTREGSQEMYFEGLRMMKRMLETNVVPTRRTFHALLEGARTQGDLARARWMLVKMVGVGGEAAPDENTLGLVFLTYARYVCPVKQETGVKTVVRKGGKEKVATVEAEVTEPVELTPLASKDDTITLDTPTKPTTSSIDTTTTSSSTSALQILDLLGDSPLFYPGPLPQTSTALLSEAKTLFTQSLSPTSTLFPSLSNPTPFLLNSYLTLLASHSTLPATYDFFNTVYKEKGVEKNRFAWEEMMKKCEGARNRLSGEKVGKEIFEEWLIWDAKMGKEREGWGRNVREMWGGMIRILALNSHLSEALTLLHKFHSLYPPSLLLSHSLSLTSPPQPLPYHPSTSPRLSSPLYPETSTTYSLCGSPSLPPFLLFEDLRILHTRFAEREDKRGVKEVGWVSWGYEVGWGKVKGVEEGRKKRGLKKMKGKEREREGLERKEGMPQGL